jgi:predicted nucleic acid-binding protein
LNSSFPPAQIEAAVRLIVSKATIVVPTIILSGVATHPEDDLVIAVAASARVDYLVTGDEPLQRLGAYRGVRLISPRAFLDLLEATSDNEL